VQHQQTGILLWLASFVCPPKNTSF